MSEPTQPTALHGSVTLAGVWLVPLFFWWWLCQASVSYENCSYENLFPNLIADVYYMAKTACRNPRHQQTPNLSFTTMKSQRSAVSCRIFCATWRDKDSKRLPGLTIGNSSKMSRRPLTAILTGQAPAKRANWPRVRRSMMFLSRMEVMPEEQLSWTRLCLQNDTFFFQRLVRLIGQSPGHIFDFKAD